MSWMKAITKAAKTVGSDAKNVAKKVADKIPAGKVNAFLKDSVGNSPYLTAGAAAGGFGLAKLLQDEPEYDAEQMRVILELRKRGMSDEEIQQYLDMMTQAQGE